MNTYLGYLCSILYHNCARTGYASGPEKYIILVHKEREKKKKRMKKERKNEWKDKEDVRK